MKKIFISFVAMFFFSFSTLGVVGASVDNTRTIYNAELQNSTTLVPVRIISEFFNASVGWEQETHKVTIEKEGVTLEIFIGKLTGTKNNQQIKLSQSPILLNNQTFVPARFVAESLDATVSWNAIERKATFTKEGKTLIAVIMDKFQVTKEMLSLAEKGKIKGSPYTLDNKPSASDILNSYGNPFSEGFHNGGYGLTYQTFTYYVDWDVRDLKVNLNNVYLSSIGVEGEKKINKSITEVKSILGKPTSEGVSDLDGMYYVLYQVGSYEIFFFSPTKNSKVSKILLKSIY